MTKLPYIDCPLWAAIAAKYHGIELVDDIEFRIDCKIGIKGLAEWAYRGVDLMKFYIHPESYNKLEPHMGDVIQYDNRWIERVLCGDNGMGQIELCGGNLIMPEEVNQILQRNDIPFPPIQWEEL